MYSATHRKQILLFLIAVILPSAVLVFFTTRMFRQERELAEKRARDQRLLLAREFGQSLLEWLERLKLEEVDVFRNPPAAAEPSQYAHSSVELIGLVDESGLKWPWEFDPFAQESLNLLNSSSFSRQIQEGERLEFAQESASQAVELYRRALASAQEPVQQGYARLLLARALRKMNLEESSANYKEVLKLPFDLVDESGIPLALYAADPLIQEHDEGRAVTERIQARFSTRDWLGPSEAYFIKALLDKIIASRFSQVTSETAASCLQLAVEHIQKVEQALALQREFRDLDLTSGDDNLLRVSPLWVPYGKTRWLVSLAPSGQESQSLLLAVGAKEALESLTADPPFGDIHSGGVSFVSASSSEGETLGPSFPGLRVTIPIDPNERLSEPSGWQFFYLFTVILVLSVTFFGAYLLWRDVRREVAAAELRSQFVSSVSHELKTPLTAIQMFAETLRLGRTRNPGARKEYLDTIVNETQRLTRLLNNVLDFSRIESGKRAYCLQPASLHEVVQDAVRAIGYPLKQGGFQLNVETENNLPKVRVDRDGLEQAILNLLDNAMKYSGDSRRIDLKLMKKDTHAVIQVTDRGLGIDPKDQERIFEKFFRVSLNDGDRIPGTGLGLPLVAHLVSTHEGRVEVESSLGEGSTFSIYLPLEGQS